MVRSRLVLAAAAAFVLGVCPLSGVLAAQLPPDAVLSAGRVAVSYRQEGDVRYVVGRIRIDQPPDKVWPILANPFEFEERISPHFKTDRVVTDKPDVSVMNCRVDIGFLLPPLKYTVVSRYQPGRRIDFHSQGGDLSNFQGFWQVVPADGGKGSIVTYSLYVVPGIPVPQWLVRQAVRIELPHTLTALRQRVDDVCSGRDRKVMRTLAAAQTTSAAI